MLLRVLVAAVLAGQAYSQDPAKSWTCDCSGYTYSLPAEYQDDWPSSGQSYAVARQSCINDGATLVTQDTDFDCFREYMDYLYEFYSLTKETSVYLYSGNSSCYSFTGCTVIVPVACDVTLRFLCQKKAAAAPSVPVVANSAASPPSSPPSISVTYTCDSGYEQTASEPITSQCVGSKYWTVPEQSCNAISCPELASPENGHLELSNGFLFQSEGKFTCDNGYVLDGGSLIHCEADKTWNGSASLCVGVDCFQPPPIPNSRVEVINTTLGHNATYFCEPGYEDPNGLTQFLTVCQASGEWNNSRVLCQELDCGKPPNYPNSIANYNTTTYQSRVLYDCTDGYEQANPAMPYQGICTANGVWRDNDVKCIGVECGIPPQLPNSDVTYTNTTYPSTALYTCDSGYENSTFLHFAACTAEGRWDTNNILCNAVDCGRPPIFPNSVRDYTATTYLSTVRYNCTEGHVQANNSSPYQAVCTADGDWQTNNVDCVGIDCGIPPPLPNSEVSYTSTTYLSIARYSCTAGYLNSTDFHTATCTAAGIWDAWKIGCEPLDCGPPPPQANGYANFTTTTFSSLATYYCIEGHVKNPESVPYTSCEASGEWQPIDIGCQVTHCPELTSPINGYVAFTNGTAFKSIIKFGCLAGYQLDGDSTLQCRDDQAWNISRPVCAGTVKCPSLPAPENGNVTRLLGSGDTDVNTVLLFSCNYGYRLNGSATTVCTVSGFWTDQAPFCQAEPVQPTTPAPSPQNKLEPPTIASITLAVIVVCLLLMLVFFAVKLRRRGRLTFFTDTSVPRYSTSGTQLSESSRYDSLGRGNRQSSETATLIR